VIDEGSENIIELYQGEVIGEVIFNQMLSLVDDDESKYKLAVLLQLETETKARLRPSLMQLGLDVRELESSRNIGLEMAASLEGMSWSEMISVLSGVVKGAVDRYEDIAANAPANIQAVADYMLVHEKLLCDFIAMEMVDAKKNSLAAIIDQLEHKPPARS
jgi:hypothetical protein